MNCSMMFKYRTIIGFIVVLILVIMSPLGVYALSDSTNDSDAKEYVVIPRVYPYTPPVELMQDIDELLELYDGLVVDIMPIYSNEDYPAMLEFCQVMAYEQAKGLVIAMHLPIIQDASATSDRVISKAMEAIEIYEQKGLVIQGIIYDDKDLQYEKIANDLEVLAPVFYLPEDSKRFFTEEKAGHYVLSSRVLKAVGSDYRPEEIPSDYDFHRNVIDDFTVNLEQETTT